MNLKYLIFYNVYSKSANFRPTYFDLMFLFNITKPLHSSVYFKCKDKVKVRVLSPVQQCHTDLSPKTFLFLRFELIMFRIEFKGEQAESIQDYALASAKAHLQSI